MTAPKILYVLECDHVMPGNAYMSGKLFCGLCNEPKTIVDVHVFEWKTWCATDKCTFARFTGLSQILAKQLAQAHWRAKSCGHDLRVGYRVNPLSRRRQQALIRSGLI